jgi:DNA-binding NarL/FixJ family response regulator
VAADAGGDVSAAPTRVVIADDQALVRAGFRMILESQPDIVVVAEACDGEEAVAACRRHRPSVVLMDVRMPNLDGIEAARRVAAMDGGAPKVLMLTTFDLDEYVYRALRAGASGFLLKDVRPEHLIAAVRQEVDGDALLAPSITRRLIERFAHPASAAPDVARDRVATLTRRELEVLKLVARGLKNSEIADALFLSESTVKTHVVRLLSKLELRDRAQAVVLAYESRIVEVGTIG